MTTRRAQFTEVEVRRALKAAKAEGFDRVIYDGPNRRRVGLKATDRFQATAEAAELVGHIEQRKPRQRLTVGQIVEMYLEQSDAIWKEVDRHHWKAGEPHFGNLRPADITEGHCKSFVGNDKRAVGSSRKALSIMRAGLRWAERKALIDKAPHIWLPPAPPPRDRRLSREEYERLRTSMESVHGLVFLELARYTAPRSPADSNARISTRTIPQN